ncbi:hypothetical protein ABIA32_003313 [Streptacidiphilus sp. MAP12-20]|uniref:hypothetical protein n=1 Tax=Streptacidiphilus sp. MAP12-20 TaxID=3156299 RepID=UPI00351303B6
MLAQTSCLWLDRLTSAIAGGVVRSDAAIARASRRWVGVQRRVCVAVTAMAFVVLAVLPLFAQSLLFGSWRLWLDIVAVLAAGVSYCSVGVEQEGV